MLEKTNNCYLCGDGDNEPNLCHECEQYALLNFDSFTNKYKRFIDAYCFANEHIHYCFTKLESFFLYGYRKDQIKYISGIKKDAIFSRFEMKKAAKGFSDQALFEKASVEIASYKLFKEVSSLHQYTKKEILEIVKIPQIRFSIFNKLYKKEKPFLYGKLDIEIMMSNFKRIKNETI